MARSIKFKNNTYLHGTIIETVHNEYGYYEKYSDGRIICYGIVELGEIVYSTQYGNIFLDSNGAKTIQIPYTFDNTNKIDSVELTITSIGGGVGGICGSGFTRQYISFYLWHAVAFTLNTKISFVVRGRWK